jgi:hypothetical protein
MFRRAGHSSIRCVAILSAPLFPIAAVERLHRHRFDGIAVDAARVDADPVRVRTGNVERLHAAGGAEEMLGDVRVERISRERLTAADQLEPIGRYDQMQIPVFVANGAIAVRDLELRRCDYFEADATAVTAAGVCAHTPG